MMFSLIIFDWSAMDGHSKCEVLEIFNMNEKLLDPGLIPLKRLK